jgi:hypothetical protein
VRERRMSEEYWLKYGQKENGELTCVKMLSNSKPDKVFFYTENGEYKKVLNPEVVKLDKNLLDSLKNGGIFK